MQERNKPEKKSYTLEERLSAYYGPPLPEQPLSEASWQRLRSQLDAQQRIKRRPRLLRQLLRRRDARALPLAVQMTFARIAYEARLSSSETSVRCIYRLRVAVPHVSVSLLRMRRPIKLTLPSDGGESLSQSELDVLLATGLARYEQMQRSAFVLVRLLLLGMIPLVLCAAIGMVLLRHDALYQLLPLSVISSIALLAAILWLLDHQARNLARRADRVMVQWIGRSQVCRGLHALSARSRTPSRRRWSDLSLTERIKQNCGGRVGLEEEAFTLAR